jgi:uncharacterized protein YdcH (DUF465 family)
MAETNQDLLRQLEANRASFEAAGFTEDVKLIDAKIKEVEGGKVATTTTTTTKKTRKTRKSTAKKGK